MANQIRTNLDLVRAKAREMATKTGKPYLIVRTAGNRWSYVTFKGYDNSKYRDGYYTELIYPNE